MIICLIRKIIQEQIFINCYKRLLLTLNNDEVYLFSMYKNKVGMIGLGNWGKNIYRNLEKFDVLNKISVTVSKLNPPINADVEAVSVTMEEKR